GQGHSSTVFFSWSNSALADGSPIPVKLMNAPTQPSPYDLTLTYAFGSPAPSTQVLQHATLGVRSTVYEIRRSAVGPGPQGDFVLYVATFAGAFGVFFLKGLVLTIFLFSPTIDLRQTFVLSGALDLVILALFYGFTLRR